MKVKAAGTLAFFAWFVFTGSAFAQDLGPQIRKLADGIYVYVGKVSIPTAALFSPGMASC